LHATAVEKLVFLHMWPAGPRRFGFLKSFNDLLITFQPDARKLQHNSTGGLLRRIFSGWFPFHAIFPTGNPQKFEDSRRAENQRRRFGGTESR
jgi:hypothetical protein